jgi:hypothetical protein
MKMHPFKAVPAVVISAALACTAAGQQPSSTTTAQSSSPPKVSSDTKKSEFQVKPPPLKTKEVPAPQSPGNPFPKNPEKPLKNPLRDDTKNLNPQKDPAIEKGIKETYKKHLDTISPTPRPKS